jgi:D-xylose transport system permease protein
MKSSVTPTSTQPVKTAPTEKATIGSFLRGGNIGQLSIVLALVLIGLFFQITSKGLFLGPRNLTDLVLQTTAIGTIGLGAVLVLLIGEIDLTAGVASYTCAAITAVLSVHSGWGAIPAILAGLAAGAIIGLINGVFVAILRVPSFVVTLAGLLAYQGIVIHVLFPQTSLIIQDPNLANIATNYLPLSLGIGLPALAVILFAIGEITTRVQRQRRGLSVPPAWLTWTRIGGTAVIVAGTVALFEAYLGVPQSAIILLGLIILFWILLRFTAYGHHVYAVGGNAEAARRAGINVTAIRVSVFVLASVLAAVGGLLWASRLDTASSEVDQTLLLNAIATAVVGGVSLFGGSGSVWAVVLGSLVIGSLSNGLALLNQNPDVTYFVEGAVLLIAITLNTLARRRASNGV